MNYAKAMDVLTMKPLNSKVDRVRYGHKVRLVEATAYEAYTRVYCCERQELFLAVPMPRGIGDKLENQFFCLRTQMMMSPGFTIGTT